MGSWARAGACAGSRRLLWRMGRCVLPNLSAKTHIAVLPGRGRACGRGRGPTSGASGVRRGGVLSRALRRRTPVPSRRTREEFLEFCVRVGDGSLAELGQSRDFLHWVVDPELVKEVVENYPVRIERGARVEALRLAPGEKLLDVLGRDKPGVGLGGRVFGKKFEDVFVFLVGEGFAERLDVFLERCRRFFSGSASSFVSGRNGKTAFCASSSRRFLFCASSASEGVSPAAARSRLPFSRHSMR